MNATQSAARAFLVDNTFVGSLPDEAIDKLVARGRVNKFSRDARIFQRGDAGDSLLVMLEGSVKICNIDSEGREVVLNFLRTGDIMGEIAVLDGGERTARAVALEKCVLFTLKREDLMPILSDHADALLEIIAILCEKLRFTSEMIETQVRNMQVRFASGLLRLAFLHGRKMPEGIAIDLVANQSDLGSYLGLSRANTSRQIAKLVREGILISEGRTLVICDEVALRQITEEVEG